MIVIIGALVTLAAPLMATLRRSAQDTASLSNMRQQGAILALYHNDWDDTNPFLAEPDASFTVFRGAGHALTAPYFHQIYLWPLPLADRYSDGVISAGLKHPAARDDLLTNYWFSSTLVARPGFWNPETREAGIAQLGPTRITEVRFPSQKAAIVEVLIRERLPTPVSPGLSSARGYRVGMALTDGSTTRESAGDLSAPYPWGESPTPGFFLSTGVYGLHTVDGIYGQDRTP